jgi:hypothetical protein
MGEDVGGGGAGHGSDGLGLEPPTSGAMKICPQVGHLTYLPAMLSGTLREF